MQLKHKAFLTRTEVSRLLSLSPRSIDRLRREGRLRGFVVKRRRLFSTEEITALIEGQQDLAEQEAR